MTNKVKTTKNLKVIEQSGYRYQATPTVMLKGKWLSEFGFEIGTQVKVECENGKLIITKEEAIADAVELLKEESPISFTGKSLTDIINMTYRCRVVFAMI